MNVIFSNIDTVYPIMWFPWKYPVLFVGFMYSMIMKYKIFKIFLILVHTNLDMDITIASCMEHIRRQIINLWKWEESI